MDIGSISAKTSTLLQQQKVGDAVGTTVHRKALDIQSQNAAALLESVPKVESSQGLPSNLGQNLNVKA